jgi:uncharacterized protein YndB with AHSA1/START domain
MSEFSFTRSTTIDAPAAAVYERLIDFTRWPEWSPWEGLDPDLQREYSDQTAGPGAHYAWSGNRKAGQGSMTITDAAEPTRVAIDLSFLKPFKADNTIVFALTETASGTTVDWTMSGRNDGLVSKVFSKLMPVEKLVGKDFDKGLAALKERSEAAVATTA